MKRFAVFAVVVASALGGCANGVLPLYVVPLARPGATYQDFMKDRLGCIEYARPRLTARGGGVRGVGEPSASVYINCMYARGWVRAKDGFTPPAAVPMTP